MAKNFSYYQCVNMFYRAYTSTSDKKLGTWLDDININMVDGVEICLRPAVIGMK